MTKTSKLVRFVRYKNWFEVYIDNEKILQVENIETLLKILNKFDVQYKIEEIDAHYDISDW